MSHSILIHFAKKNSERLLKLLEKLCRIRRLRFQVTVAMNSHTLLADEKLRILYDMILIMEISFPSGTQNNNYIFFYKKLLIFNNITLR